MSFNVRGGFLTSYLADVTLPPLLYVVCRGLAPTKRHSVALRWLGRTPERAAASLFLASSVTELSQVVWPVGVFSGRYDPWDVAAFGVGLLSCYSFDKLSSRRADSKELT